MSNRQPSHPPINRRNFLKSAGVATAVAATTTLVQPGLAQEGGDSPPVTAMRSPHNQLLQPTGALPNLPPVGIIALNRMGFRPRPGDLAAFNALRATDEARLAAYVAQQLNPTAIDDSVFEAQLNASGFLTVNKSLAQLWADHQEGAPPPEYITPTGRWRELPLEDVQRITFNRALHSRRQLLEVVVDFWHNHFNVYA